MILFIKPLFFLRSNNAILSPVVALILLTTFYFTSIAAVTTTTTTTATTTTTTTTTATATETVSEKVQVRKPSAEKTESFREQRDFSYSRSLKPVDNVWERFWRWVGYQIGRLLEKTSYDYFWKPLLYIILIASIIFVILKLFGVEIRSVFTKAPSAVTVPYNVIEENIHELNLDELIALAAEKKNYRLAVRYLYLKILKQLNDSGNIEWKPGKTNRMYAVELNKSNLHRPFEYLTTQFEYVWYGEFEVNDHSYENVKIRFTEFGNGIAN
ncbi:MAG: DUF4129 domain-containing protein [Bacteroidia bacterium]